jgi:hypothetical protein
MGSLYWRYHGESRYLTQVPSINGSRYKNRVKCMRYRKGASLLGHFKAIRFPESK